MLSLSSQSECVPERPCDAQKKEQDRVPNVVKKEFSQVPHVPFVAEGGFINNSAAAKPIGRILCVPNVFPSSPPDRNFAGLWRLQSFPWYAPWYCTDGSGGPELSRDSHQAPECFRIRPSRPSNHPRMRIPRSAGEVPDTHLWRIGKSRRNPVSGEIHASPQAAANRPPNLAARNQ